MTDKNIRILIVDDSADSRDITEGHIKDYIPTAEIVMAPDGLEGLKVLRNQSIDLVITDEVMPKKSGTDLIKEASNLGIACPFIILTGLRMQDLTIDKRQAHRIRVLEKPMTGPDIHTALHATLGIEPVTKKSA